MLLSLYTAVSLMLVGAGAAMSKYVWWCSDLKWRCCSSIKMCVVNSMWRCGEVYDTWISDGWSSTDCVDIPVVFHITLWLIPFKLPSLDEVFTWLLSDMREGVLRDRIHSRLKFQNHDIDITTLARISWLILENLWMGVFSMPLILVPGWSGSRHYHCRL